MTSISPATTDTTPRVWLRCPACYAAGRLLGQWYGEIDAESRVYVFRSL